MSGGWRPAPFEGIGRSGEEGSRDAAVETHGIAGSCGRDHRRHDLEPARLAGTPPHQAAEPGAILRGIPGAHRSGVVLDHAPLQAAPVDTKLSYMGAVLADAARDIASWSSMQLLRNLSMSRLAQRTERVMKECKYFFAPSMQYIMGLIEAVGYITSGLFGVAVLAVKATQIDFVSVHMMSAYSIGEWLRLVSFTMSMVNIFDIDTENRRAVQEFLTSDYEQVDRDAVASTDFCCLGTDLGIAGGSKGGLLDQLLVDGYHQWQGLQEISDRRRS